MTTPAGASLAAGSPDPAAIAPMGPGSRVRASTVRVQPDGRAGSSDAAGHRPKVGTRAVRHRRGRDSKARFRIGGLVARSRLARGRTGCVRADRILAGFVREGLAPAAFAPRGHGPVVFARAAFVRQGRVSISKAAREADPIVRTAPPEPRGASGGPTTHGLPGPQDTAPVAEGSGPDSAPGHASATGPSNASARGPSNASAKGADLARIGSNRAAKASNPTTPPASLYPPSAGLRNRVVSPAAGEQAPPARVRASALVPISARCSGRGGQASDSEPTARRAHRRLSSPPSPPISTSPGPRNWTRISLAPPTPAWTRPWSRTPALLGTMARPPRGSTVLLRAPTSAPVPAASSIAGPSWPPARPARRGLGRP